MGLPLLQGRDWVGFACHFVLGAGTQQMFGKCSWRGGRKGGREGGGKEPRCGFQASVQPRSSLAGWREGTPGWGEVLFPVGVSQGSAGKPVCCCVGPTPAVCAIPVLPSRPRKREMHRGEKERLRGKRA